MNLDTREQLEHIQRALDTLRETNRVSGCALLTLEGFVVSASLDPGLVPGIGAVGGELRATSTRISEFLSLGRLQEAFLVGEEGTTLLRPIGEAHLLLVISPPEVTFGWVRVAANQVTQAIEDALSS